MMNQLFTWYGLLLHVVWGVALCCAPYPMSATPLNYFARIMGFNQYLTALGLFIVSILCVIGVVLDRREGTKYDIPALLCVIPQQFVMIVCALGSIMAIVTSQYADGVLRNFTFILADQIPFIVAAGMYTAAILNNFGRDIWTRT